MKNSYLIGGIVVLVVLIGFIFASRKSEAPIQERQEEKVSNPVFSDGDYIVDTSSASIIHWEAEYLTGKTENGIIKFKSGTISVKEGLMVDSELILDMENIESDTHQDSLVNLLKSPEVLDAEKFPTAKFVLKKIQPTSPEGAKAGRYVFAGDLTIKGITKPISLIATVVGNQNSLNLTASFAINRADWEIKYNSPSFFHDLGDEMIRDGVIIKLDLKGEKVIQ